MFQYRFDISLAHPHLQVSNIASTSPDSASALSSSSRADVNKIELKIRAALALFDSQNTSALGLECAEQALARFLAD
jgi:hypothetical protein